MSDLIFFFLSLSLSPPSSPPPMGLAGCGGKLVLSVPQFLLASPWHHPQGCYGRSGLRMGLYGICFPMVGQHLDLGTKEFRPHWLQLHPPPLGALYDWIGGDD